MQTIKHRQYCWYLDFWYCWYFIIFGLVIVKTYVSLVKGNIYSFTLLSLFTNVCYSVWKSIKFFSVCRNRLFLEYKHSNQYVKNNTKLFSANQTKENFLLIRFLRKSMWEDRHLKPQFLRQYLRTEEIEQWS